MPPIGTATVAPVPATATNIISVIAIFVALPGLDTSLRVRLLGWTIFRLWRLVAEAYAFAAITTELRFQSLARVARFEVQLVARVTMTRDATIYSIGGTRGGRGSCGQQFKLDGRLRTTNSIQ